MSEPKTKPSNKSVTGFLNSVLDEQKRKDSFVLLEMFEEITGQNAVMWGKSIIGFGKYHFKSERSSQEADWPLVGFSPRKQYLSIYAAQGNEVSHDLLSKLGKHKMSLACIYIYKLSDVDLEVLKKLIKISYDYAKANHK